MDAHEDIAAAHQMRFRRKRLDPKLVRPNAIVAVTLTVMTAMTAIIRKDGRSESHGTRQRERRFPTRPVRTCFYNGVRIAVKHLHPPGPTLCECTLVAFSVKPLKVQPTPVKISRRRK
jgi:hypothetical protein